MLKEFWHEEVLWSFHPLNRCPTYSLRNKIQEEAWLGNRPSLEYFHVFGCITFTHAPSKLSTGQYDKCENNIFLGINEESKAYKLYNLATQKVIILRYVIFDE